MLNTPVGKRGIVTAPHHLAAQAGLAVLREGGNAIEAMVAAAAAIAVVYPHMNAIGGDGFWIVCEPGRTPVGIDACGAAGHRVDAALYASRGLAAVPARGPLAANTVAGTLSGWQEALALSHEWGGRLPLSRLVEDAVWWGEHGIAPSESQRALTQSKLAELADVPGFAAAFLDEGRIPAPDRPFRQPRLAATLRALARDGIDDFYRGALARAVAADLARAGSPIDAQDLAAHRARRVAPLEVRLRNGRVFNMPPPTQGVATLAILGLFDRLDVAQPEGFDYVHGLVECTKRAFRMRDAHVTDPACMDVDPRRFLEPAWLDAQAARIDPARAAPWPDSGPPSDTIWMGVIDGAGRAVSFIQSIYWEFGCGVVLEDTGVLWQNRGASFQLAAEARNALRPGRKPFHTLNPSAALLDDGRTMVFGTMGGEGQPQTQAAVFTRYARFGIPLQRAVTAPRWLLGRTWGAESTTLKLEARFPAALVERLRAAGHAVEMAGEFDDVMGHAGALVHRPQGLLEGATDPRSNGCVAAF